MPAHHPLPPIFPLGLFPGPNVQVTSFTWYPGERNSRSECDLVTNPTDSNNLIAVSKRFYDWGHYRFTVASAYTMDGGLTWQKSGDVNLWGETEETGGYTDPALAMDQNGVGYLVAEPDMWTDQPFPQDVISQGMFVFCSTDGGASWSPIPVLLEERQAGDDKQWATADNNQFSNFTERCTRCGAPIRRFGSRGSYPERRFGSVPAATLRLPQSSPRTYLLPRFA